VKKVKKAQKLAQVVEKKVVEEAAGMLSKVLKEKATEVTSDAAPTSTQGNNYDSLVVYVTSCPPHRFEPPNPSPQKSTSSDPISKPNSSIHQVT
jgi:hypothetical protein